MVFAEDSNALTKRGRKNFACLRDVACKYQCCC